jgi:hypothetical protein
MRVLKITLGLALGAAALTLAAWAALPSMAQTQSPTPTPEATPSTPLKPERGIGIGRHGGGDFINAAASVTGLTQQEVLTALQGGQSLAQIAESKGKTAADVIQAARQTLADKLTAAVTAGRLTQAQADTQLQQFDQTAEQIVNDTTLGQRSGGCPFNQPAPTTPTTPTTPGGSSAPQPQLSVPGLSS